MTQSQTHSKYASAAGAEGSDGVSPLMSVSPHDALDRLIPDSVRETLGLATGRLLGTVTEAGGITTTTFGTSGGCRIIARQDGDALELEGHNGEELIFRVELRDRRLDGRGVHGRLSPLNHFRVDHEVTNGLPHPNFRAVEITVYSYRPGHYMAAGQLREFITNPDPRIFPWNTFDPERFFPLWLEAFHSGNAPWQPAPPIKGFAHSFVSRAAHLLTELGFHRVEAVCGWYNDVTFFQKQGYDFLDPGHAANFRLLQEALPHLEQRERQQRRRSLVFNDRHHAWWVALQNVPSLFLSHPDSPYFADFGHLYMGGLRWTNSPSSSDYCCRLAKPLNRFIWPGK